MARRIRFFFYTLVIFIFFLFSVDALMGAAGFPYEMEDSITYGRNFTSTIKWLRSEFKVSCNRYGIRYPNIPLWRESSDEMRVAVLGDSFTEGEGVEVEENWPSHLEERFSAGGRKVRFINCGISGAGPYEYIQIFFRVAVKYHPEKLLILFYANDTDDTSLVDFTEPHWEFTPLYEDPPVRPRTGAKYFLHALFPHIYSLCGSVWHSPRFDSRGVSVVRNTVKEATEDGIPKERIQQWKSLLPKETIELIDQGRLQDNWIKVPLVDPTYWSRSFEMNGPDFKPKWKIMEAYLSKLIQYCRMNRIEVAAAYAPHPYQYDPTFSDLPKNLGLVVKNEWMTSETPMEKKLAGWAAKEKVPFLNLTPLFREAVKQNTAPVNFNVDPHWNAEGHRLAARFIGDWLKTIWPDLSS